MLINASDQYQSYRMGTVDIKLEIFLYEQRLSDVVP